MYVVSPASSLARIRQKTQPSSAAAASTYSLRHPAHSLSSVTAAPGSRAVFDLVAEAVDERPHRHVALDLPAAGVHADGAGFNVGVADHQHVGDLLELGLADAAADVLVGGGHIGP